MKQRTYAMIKPHAVQEGLTGAVISRIEKEGFTIAALKKIQFTKDLAEKFYAVHTGKPFFSELVSTTTSGPVVAMVLEKENAVADWRAVMGATNPAQAESNTLRKLYAKSIGENTVHGSDAAETAAEEIALIFPELA